MTDHNADAGGGGFGSNNVNLSTTTNISLLSDQEQGIQFGAAVEAPNDHEHRDNNHLLVHADNGTATVATGDSNGGDVHKKKRVADRQITKDDKEEEGENGDQPASGEFAKADAATLAKRRILRARRPDSQHNETMSAVAETSSNPFASVKLSSSSSTITNAGAAPSKDGAITSTGSSNPFANIALKVSGNNNGSNAGPESSNVFGSGSGFLGFKSSNPGGIFGGISATPTTTPLASSETTATTAIFGSGASTSSGLGTSWFSPPPAGTTPFAFAATPTVAVVGTSNSTSGDAVSTENKKEILPEHVELSTGEEEEHLMVEVRVKTYKRVSASTENESLQGGSASNQQLSNTGGDQDGKTPSVPPSSATAPMVSKVVNGDETALEADSSVKHDASTTQETRNGSILDSKPFVQGVGGQVAAVAAVAAVSSSSSLPWRWQEVGTGPLRLLGRAVDFNASSVSQCRLVQRRESTPNGPATKVILNVPLWRETSIQRPSEKHVQITTLVYESTDTATAEPETFLFKLKTTSEAAQLQGKLDELVKTAKSCIGSNHHA
jgi:hypothetical protein